MIKKFENFDFVEDKLNKFIEYFKSILYIIEDDFPNVSFEVKLLGKLVQNPLYPGQVDYASAKDMCREIGGIGGKMVKCSMAILMAPPYRGYREFNRTFIDSDQYLEFIDRLENYCDENGLIFGNSSTNGGLFHIFVKNTEKQ